MQSPGFDLQSIVPYLPYLVPLLLIQISLQIWAMVALFRPGFPPRHLNKWAWFAIILLFNSVGAIVFLAIGRTQEE